MLFFSSLLCIIITVTNIYVVLKGDNILNEKSFFVICHGQKDVLENCLVTMYLNCKYIYECLSLKAN